MSEYQDYGFHNTEAAHTVNYLLPPLIELIDKDKAILDLGCGNGYLANYLIDAGYNAYGTDASEKGIVIAASKSPGRFFVQDLSTDQLPEGLKNIRFDTVISTEVIEHLYDPEQFIRTCRQILTDTKGSLIISTPYHGYLKNLVLALFNKWDTHLDPLWRGGHIKMWSKATLTRILEQNGFKVTAFKGCGRWPWLWKSMMIKAVLIDA